MQNSTEMELLFDDIDELVADLTTPTDLITSNVNKIWNWNKIYSAPVPINNEKNVKFKKTPKKQKRASYWTQVFTNPAW